MRVPTAGFPLVVSRTYNSGSVIDGPNGTPLVFKRRLTVYYAVYLFAAPSTYQKVAHIVMPDGSRWTFVDNGTSTFTPPLGRHYTLVRNPDGSSQLTLQRSRVRLLFGTSGSLRL